ncbi:M4 family metallopeptidase [Rubricoccus marinus]|uniref:CUB domain-containing protein n=1 Tax=Rubricoccus marinus TaxID=716817 RepID=A0A259TY15_9BACT|nr:M4 family metallopeptidase [Rubricoccus marinus]OZC02665.1 hypothetical protein BSZ36_06560 [Rubricoccus marinus]
MPIEHVGRWTRRAFYGAALGLLASPSFAQDKAPLEGAAFSRSDVERIEWSDASGVPTYLAGRLGTVTAKTNAPASFFAANEGLFRVEPDDIVTTSVETDDLGLTHVRVQQTVDGVPVFGGDAALHLSRGGEVYAYGGTLHPDADLVATRPALGASGALASARAVLGPVTERKSASGADEFGHEPMDWTPKADLVVYPHDGTYLLAYRVQLFVDAPTPANWNVFVDAQTGQVIDRYNTIHTFDAPAAPMVFASVAPEVGSGTSTFGGSRTIPTYSSGGTYYLYDTTRGPSYIRTMTGNNGTSLPGSYITDTDNNFTDTAARAGVDAHYGAVTVYDYYQNTHGRNSYNGAGANITSTVHHRVNYNNAFWNGQQMVYGDGDGSQFQALVDLDIVAHELTHAVTGATAGLIYQNESGALNEAVSDIMAVMVDRDDWRLGELSYTPGVSGDALRNLANPPEGNQPDNYADRYTGSQDNGGVHINSGIPNKAAYLMAAGGTFRGVTVASIGRAKTEKIWYRALTQYFTSSTNLAGARQGTLSATADLYGSGGAEYAAVQNAWAAVGIGSGASGGGGTPPSGGTPEWRYETITVESAHNYANNTNTTNVYSKPGASRVAAYFERFELENNYDFVYMKNGSNQTTATYTGTKSAFWAIVDDSELKINFVSDYSVTGYGWRVTRFAYFADRPLLVADGEEGIPMAEAPQGLASDVITGVSAKAALVTGLEVPRPNPASGASSVVFSLEEAGEARVALYDVLGREVAVLHDGQTEAGEHDVAFDARSVPAGSYIIVMQTGAQRLTQRLTVVR